MFYFDTIDERKILKSDILQNVEAFFTTREICICDKGQDTNFKVENNKKLVAKYLNITSENLISPQQTHSANIDVVKVSHFFYPDTDALILTNKSQAIFLNFADCTPIILFDSKQNIGAIAHAGWRGTAQKIAPKTVKKMASDFGSKPENIIAVIGPAICEKCYEVGEEVFNKLNKTINNSISKSLSNKNGKYFVNLKEINKKQLVDIGVEKIDICPYCTCCNNQYFFSYRKENGTTLRHSAILKLK